MQKFMTRYQIEVEIFKNLYGGKPSNLAYDEYENTRMDDIKKMVKRYQELFELLWTNSIIKGKNGYQIEWSIAQLMIAEGTFRGSLKSTQKSNNQRTRFMRELSNCEWHKVTTDSLSAFFMPFLEALEPIHPIYIAEFRHKFQNFLEFFSLLSPIGIKKSQFVLTDLLTFLECLRTYGELPTTDYESKIKGLLF